MEEKKKKLKIIEQEFDEKLFRNKYRSMRLCSALNNNDLHSYDNPLSQEPCSVESVIRRMN